MKVVQITERQICPSSVAIHKRKLFLCPLFQREIDNKTRCLIFIQRINNISINTHDFISNIFFAYLNSLFSSITSTPTF